MANADQKPQSDLKNYEQIISYFNNFGNAPFLF